ncbi:hypothetical protein [Actinoplanes sp. NPDC051411]|uniref:formylglycine-generating enzyme family protein n=1 Tax=Actinoplanes sp. NPDC051411 TaxID=3155522 RepID=UPI00342C93F1
MAELIETVVTGRPAWRHEPSGVVFRRIPAGHFRMGLSDEELEAVGAMLDDEDPEIVWYPNTAAECRPAHWVTVPAFLLARQPLTVAQARHFLPGYDDGEIEFADDEPAIIYREKVLERMLDVLPFRLPSEAEWERVARAGTTTLTYWGDMAPREETDLDPRHENPFGLAAVGCATEVCADTYRPGYHHVGDDAVPHLGDGPRVTRGGAAFCRPWQGCGEETLMFSAVRAGLYPQKPVDLIVTGIRPALDWPGPPEMPPRPRPDQLTLLDWPTEPTAAS